MRRLIIAEKPSSECLCYPQTRISFGRVMTTVLHSVRPSTRLGKRKAATPLPKSGVIRLARSQLQRRTRPAYHDLHVGSDCEHTKLSCTLCIVWHLNKHDWVSSSSSERFCPFSFPSIANWIVGSDLVLAGTFLLILYISRT